jgi:uncharacterized membrane protein
MLDEIKEAFKFSLMLWIILIAVPMGIVFAVVVTRSLITGVVLTGIALYPMYRILRKNEQAQAGDMDNKKFLNMKEQEEAISYMLDAKQRKDEREARDT